MPFTVLFFLTLGVTREAPVADEACRRRDEANHPRPGPRSPISAPAFRPEDRPNGGNGGFHLGEMRS